MDPRRRRAGTVRLAGGGVLTVRIGIIGAGAIAERHAVALRAAGARLVAVADPDPRRAAVFAEPGAGTATYSNVDELLLHPGLDAVVIASPNDMHADQAVDALQAGLSVLVEIPVATSLAGAEAVAAAAATAGRYAAVAHTLRFCAPYRRVRDMVDGGLRVRHVVARTLMLRQEDTGMGGRPRTWTDDMRWHHGAHTVDAALWLLAAGSASVAGTSGPIWSGNGRAMDAGLVLDTRSGALATVALSYHSRLATRDLTVIAEDVTLRIEGPRLISADGVVVDFGSTEAMEHDGLVRQDEDFVQAVADDRRPACVVEDVLPTMRILEQLDPMVEV